MQLKKKLLGAGIAVALGAAGTASATTGYAPHGIGMKAKGMGGVGIAIAQDAVAAGMNPANMAWVGNRVDLGVDIFRPIRDASRTGSLNPALDGNFDANGTKLFPIPEFGLNLAIDSAMTVGVSVFGNGGMNTDYKTAIPAFGTSKAGVDLAQMFVVPNFSYKLNQDNAVGVGLNLVVQAFEASGLQNFDGAPSATPGKVTNNGHDISYGAGLRVGWTGKVAPGVTVGATYQTRTYMTEFDDYKGLFAEQGDFDIPSNYGIGVAVEATPDLTIAADFMRINYGEVDSISNTIACFVAGTCQLGANNGPGFGWKDQNIVKVGVAYKAQPNLLLRAGYVHGSAVIPSSEVLFNFLAPATVQNHLTLGGTYTLGNGDEVTFAYMHAFEESIKGSIAAALGGGTGEIKMHQDSLGVAYSWKF
ncbi:MAG: long-chain fatty acid transporter [Gammaproteobacteria bacterium]|nr:MAG: long-chain fatty acid transporter [Gammaproteobacteria bacterium]